MFSDDSNRYDWWQRLIFILLRRYAANDKIFKLFFLHSFLASTIYNNTIKNKIDIGKCGFFRDTGF